MANDFNCREKVSAKLLVIEVHLLFLLLFKGNVLLLDRQCL